LLYFLATHTPFDLHVVPGQQSNKLCIHESPLIQSPPLQCLLPLHGVSKQFVEFVDGLTKGISNTIINMVVVIFLIVIISFNVKYV